MRRVMERIRATRLSAHSATLLDSEALGLSERGSSISGRSTLRGTISLSSARWATSSSQSRACHRVRDHRGRFARLHPSEAVVACTGCGWTA